MENLLIGLGSSIPLSNSRQSKEKLSLDKSTYPLKFAITV